MLVQSKHYNELKMNENLITDFVIVFIDVVGSIRTELFKLWTVYQTLHKCQPPSVDSISKGCQKFRAPSDVIATIFAVSKLKFQPPEKSENSKSLKPKTIYIFRKLSKIDIEDF